MEPIYLDNAATTRVAPEVRDAMLPFLDERFGNPSSRHPIGVSAADAVAEARRQVAAATGARPEDVFLVRERMRFPGFRKCAGGVARDCNPSFLMTPPQTTRNRATPRDLGAKRNRG